MPLVFDMVCSACEAKQFLISDALSLQLDDGSIRILAHPGTSYGCERQGPTLHEASCRRRLFKMEFFLCRNCGGETYDITPAHVQKDIWSDPSPWFTFKLTCAVSAIGVPVALWMRQWDWVVVLTITPPFAFLHDLREQRKERLQRIADGRPELPTPNAPGLHPIAAPTPPSDCCERPDRISVVELLRTAEMPCPVCRSGIQKVTSSGIA